MKFLVVGDMIQGCIKFDDLIDKSSTIYEAEVVRCEDCWHWYNGDCDFYFTTPDDYCNLGERSE